MQICENCREHITTKESEIFTVFLNGMYVFVCEDCLDDFLDDGWEIVE